MNQEESVILKVYLTRCNLPQIVGIYGINDKNGRRLTNYDCGNEPRMSLYCELTLSSGRVVYSLEPYLPAILFLGKKEGDIIEVSEPKGYKFMLCQQTGGDTRKFEDVFRDKFANDLYKLFPSINYKPEISFSKQSSMFKKFKGRIN